MSKVDIFLASLPPSYRLFHINYTKGGINLSLNGLISSLEAVKKIMKKVPLGISIWLLHLFLLPSQNAKRVRKRMFRKQEPGLQEVLVTVRKRKKSSKFAKKKYCFFCGKIKGTVKSSWTQRKHVVLYL